MSTSSNYAAAHLQPKGPGDARPTAMQIIQDEGLQGKLTDKVVLITGAASGIGVETARALYATGAHLYLPVRDRAKGEATVADIKRSLPDSKGSMQLLELELGSLQSVRDCAAAFLKHSDRLNILICNAGVMATPQGKTEDGFETQFGTNHLGHFLLFQLLKPALLKASSPAFQSRVVCLTSSGHRYSPVLFDDLDLSVGGYTPFKAYGQSKTANIHMATEIERRYGARGLHATAVHPGGIMTNLARHLGADVIAGFIKASPGMAQQLKDAQQGAATTVWAAVGREWEGTGGKYLEDVSVAKPAADPADLTVHKGFVPWAYDTQAANRLWTESCKMVGVKDDDADSSRQ
jgi:NAD(P)-dependent dehydrogenase (short-subunit alcohol dehydrogenase family)